MKQKTIVQQLLEKFDKCNGQLIREDLEESLLFEKYEIQDAFNDGVNVHRLVLTSESGKVPNGVDYYYNKYTKHETN